MIWICFGGKGKVKISLSLSVLIGSSTSRSFPATFRCSAFTRMDSSDFDDTGKGGSVFQRVI